VSGKVVSVRKWAPHKGEVDMYIARACTMGGHDYREDSDWHNPYPVPEYPLEESLRLYVEHIRSRPDLMARLLELEGKNLGCWYAGDPKEHKRRPTVLTAEGPVYCHGQLILRLIDERKGVEAGGAQEEAA